MEPFRTTFRKKCYEDNEKFCRLQTTKGSVLLVPKWKRGCSFSVFPPLHSLSNHPHDTVPSPRQLISFWFPSGIEKSNLEKPYANEFSHLRKWTKTISSNSWEVIFSSFSSPVSSINVISLFLKENDAFYKASRRK